MVCMEKGKSKFLPLLKKQFFLNLPSFMTLEEIMVYLTGKLNQKQVILTFG